MEDKKLTVTVNEAASILGISRGLAYEMVRSGKLPALRLGKRLLVPKGSLLRLLDEPGKCIEQSTIQT